MHAILPDPRLDRLYRHWLSKRRGRALPCRAAIDPLEIPAEIWPHTMLLDVVWEDGKPRFRYRRVGDVFWRLAGREPTGLFIEDVLPEKAGYRRYVTGIYEEMATRRAAMYTENSFTLAGRGMQMLTRRVSLPLSNDGEAVNMVLAGHVFEHGKLPRETAFSLVSDLKELRRTVLEDPVPA
ncbi:MAG TPA: hypothetical protein VEI03_11365 [Stellaceae bacterium]|nr:hypothetical protein [Stellaceae bacterium]